MADITILQDTSVLTINTNTKSNFIFFVYNNLKGVSLSNDKEKLKPVFNNASQLSISLKLPVHLIEEQFDYAKSLPVLFNNEYHLEKTSN
jgi:hypothetical protein